MMKSFKRFVLITSATFAITFANASMAIIDISGAGATFPAPLYSEWAEAYRSETYSIVRYKPLHSVFGTNRLIQKKVDFGATEAPFTTEDLDQKGLFQFPAVIGGVVPVFRLDDISTGQLKLTGEVLADIFMGKIRKWNDPKIAAHNIGLTLPNKTIIIFRRPDRSGTTFIFTSYLSKVSSSWKNQVGEGHSVSWTTGKNGKDNETIARFVKRTNGSISYVGYSYAARHELPIIQLKNRDGNFVEAGSNSFQAAIENAQWDANDGFNTSLTDQPGKDSWPITGASYIVIKKTQESASIGDSILSFFDWGFTKGSDSATSLGYIPLPESLINIVREAWLSQVKDSKGNAVWEEQK
ncbi:MAG: phosphate ABC transporter substrate-binding protein PstS [Gallionella sp.]